MTDSSEIASQINVVKGRGHTRRELARLAVPLAASLLDAANAARTRADRRLGEKMSRLMNDPAGKSFTVTLADRAFRSSHPAVVTGQLRKLIRGYGAPEYLSRTEKFLLRAGAVASRVAPAIVSALVTRTLRAESSAVILPGEPEKLRAHIARRRAENIRLNLNRLGEAILGEEEAAKKLRVNLDLLASPDVDYISLKISSVFSRCSALAFEHTVDEIRIRLRECWRAAAPGGGARPKFVNLDMEEYRDLELTLAAFMRTLDEPEFLGLSAGIVLQAYLPDSRDALRRLTEWAKVRVAAGGAPVKVRIVKGANLAMETAEATIRGWESAPYADKASVDANYKGCIHYALTPENTRAVRVGVASHNLFDVAYALLLRSAQNLEDTVEIEMLEGMANHQAAAVRSAAGGILLYAPVVTADDFQSAVAYLVRRLDENTAEQNFLHDLFDLRAGSPAWKRQEEMFLNAADAAETVPTSPRRTQNRAAKVFSPADFAGDHRASPDTDWALGANRDWLAAHMEKVFTAPPPDVPLTIGGEDISPEPLIVGKDPSRPGVTAYRHALADDALVERALETAVRAGREWAATTRESRREILLRVAAEFENARGELIATMMLDGGKTAAEADAELSEAVDFANFYARAFDDEELYSGAKGTPLGVVTIAPPWNFPAAIPAGGILAALMAGCSVILKPAPETVLCARRMIEVIWRAGVPREVAQFAPAPDDATGLRLIIDPRVAAVVLTGGTATAEMFLARKPDLRLFGETGGKNALIITATADRDLAIKDLVKSAFGHAGQKCSAASLAILEAEVYDDPDFRRRLRDAASSQITGPARNLATETPPLIREPDEATLGRALTENGVGESWLLEPKNIPGNPNLWTPGIKLGVTPDAWFHHTECFGPVLGLVRADNLAHAIGIANSSEFGLTGGIHTLDEEEIERWVSAVEVGNAYVNRPITGAIVNRQPFGGWKRSAYGPGAKAGGRNYVAQFLRWENADTLPVSKTPAAARASAMIPALVAYAGDSCVDLLAAAAAHQAKIGSEEFAVEHDPAALGFESNVFRYRPEPGVLIRFTKTDSPQNLAVALLAAATAGVTATLSAEPGATAPKIPGLVILTETEDQLAARLDRDGFDGPFRAFSEPGEKLRRAINAAHLRPLFGPGLANARLEMRGLFREQSVSRCLHRYGAMVPPPKFD